MNWRDKSGLRTWYPLFGGRGDGIYQLLHQRKLRRAVSSRYLRENMIISSFNITPGLSRPKSLSVIMTGFDSLSSLYTSILWEESVLIRKFDYLSVMIPITNIRFCRFDSGNGDVANPACTHIAGLLDGNNFDFIVVWNRGGASLFPNGFKFCTTVSFRTLWIPRFLQYSLQLPTTTTGHHLLQCADEFLKVMHEAVALCAKIKDHEALVIAASCKDLACNWNMSPSTHCVWIPVGLCADVFE